MPRRVLCIEGDADAPGAACKACSRRDGLRRGHGRVRPRGDRARAHRRRPTSSSPTCTCPDIEGYELAARLKREKALENVPIVAVGDSREEHDVALAAGADGFVERALRGRAPRRASCARSSAGKRERLPEEGERERLRALSGDDGGAPRGGARRRAPGATRGSSSSTELKSAFMHNLAHELSTPLTPLAGYLRILPSEKLGAARRRSRSGSSTR